MGQSAKELGLDEAAMALVNQRLAGGRTPPPSSAARPEVDITDLLREALGRNPPTAAEVLGRLARSLKAAADDAWRKTDAWGSRGDVTEQEHARGRAHAFCEALGDQEALGMYGAWDEPEGD